jgi:hypothetical protein
LSGNVRSDPSDDFRASVLYEFVSDRRLGFAEAVAQESFTGGLFLPHRHPDVVGVKLITGVAEVHRFAGRIAAESVVRLLNSAKSHLRQQCFDCLELHCYPALSAVRAPSCVRFGRDRIATDVHCLQYQP